MIYDIVPYIDNNFRTIPDRAHRAVGGISRGGGWAWQFALQNPDVFGIVGLHSPAIFPDDRVNLEYWLKNRVSSSWPHIYMDTGRDDHELGYNSILEGMLAGYNIPHEWHLNIGDHTLNYWSKHVTDYLTWYADQFAHAGPPLPTLTPTPSPAPTFTPTLTPTITPSALPAYASTATAEAAEATPTKSTPAPTPTVTPAP
jgi:S-formylglutathione hydrolase FrmB